jgi:hypothetical protein
LHLRANASMPLGFRCAPDAEGRGPDSVCQWKKSLSQPHPKSATPALACRILLDERDFDPRCNCTLGKVGLDLAPDLGKRPPGCIDVACKWNGERACGLNHLRRKCYEIARVDTRSRGFEYCDLYDIANTNAGPRSDLRHGALRQQHQGGDFARGTQSS